VDLTKKQIEDSPSLDSEKPVSRQFEESFYGHYDFTVYWVGPKSWGFYPYIERDRGQWKTPTQKEKAWDPHLRGTQAVSGYNNRKARVGRNPATGETIQIKAKRVVKFRVAKAAKDAILGTK